MVDSYFILLLTLSSPFPPLHNPGTYMHGGDGGQDDEPEPHQDEDFLVQDVLRKDAHQFPRYDGARRSEFLEAAHRHSREGRDKGVVHISITHVEVDDLERTRKEGKVRWARH